MNTLRHMVIAAPSACTVGMTATYGLPLNIRRA
jgi:hypothetical protein